MERKEFAVGQKWLDRSGSEVEIQHVYPGLKCPVMTTAGRLHYEDGSYLSSGESYRDLITLAHDAPESSPVEQVTPLIEVGQVWVTRNGDRVTIKSVDGSYSMEPEFPIATEFGLTYSTSGRYLKCNKSGYDLMCLASDDAPAVNAETIADGLLGDAREMLLDPRDAQCPDHDDMPTADDDWSDWVELPSNQESLLVDNLILKMVPANSHAMRGWEEPMMDSIENIMQRRQAILKAQVAE